MKKNLTFWIFSKGLQKTLLKMKFCFIIVLISTLQISASVYSQNLKLSISGKNTTISEIFRDIEEQSEFKFIYSNDLIDEHQEISIDAKNKNIDEILTSVLDISSYDYKVLETNLIVIYPKEEDLQTSNIKGNVKDEEGIGLPGVSIFIDGTIRGTVTDRNGNFELEDVTPETILVFSFVGFLPQRIKVGDEPYLNVTLVQDIVGLEEVVVTAMGITRETKALGYAITNLKSEEITESSESNFANALAGKVAGVQVTSTSGDVGSSTRIVLRGVSSLSGNNSPLIVVDGIPIDNSSVSTYTVDWGSGLNELNMEDIAEMSILKGASAAALYGSRAANGVILITTKSGKNTKGLGVKVTSRLKLYEPFRLPDYQSSYGAGYDVDYYNYWTTSTGSAFGPKLNDGQYFVQMHSPMVRNANGEILYDENGIPVFQPLPWEAKKNMDDFFEVGNDLINTIEISKSGENFSARVSYSHLEQNGMVYNTDYHKDDFSLSGIYNLTDKIKINSSFQLHMGGSDNRTYGDNYPENAVKSALFMPANYDFDVLRDYRNLPGRDIPLSSFVYPNSGYDGVQALNWDLGDYFPNPFFLLENKMLQHEFTNFLAIFGAEVKINDWLTATGRIAREHVHRQYEDKANDGVKHWTGSVYSYKGFYNNSIYKKDNTTMNFNFRANKTFNKIALNALVGGERYHYKNYDHGFRIPELTISGFFNPKNAASDIENWSYESEKKVNSLFGSFEIGFDEAIFFEVTGRNDWSSTLPANNRSYFYPSAKVSALLDKYLPMPSWVSFLKLRGSVAQVGNDTGPYNIAQVYSSRNDITGVYDATIADALKNPTLKPERTRAWEIGTDIRLFNGRVNLDAAYYYRESFDQIMRIDVSSTTGYRNRFINVGQMDNQGVELAMNVFPIRTRDLTWELGFTYAKNKNEVVELAEGVEKLEIGSGIWGVASWAIPGKPYGEIYGPGYQRNEDGKIITENGFTPRTDHDIRLGNIMPDWTGGLRSSFRYKNISAGVLLDIKMGGDLHSATVQHLRLNGLVAETNNPELRENGAIVDGVMNVGTEDAPVWVDNNVAITFSDFCYTTNEYYLYEAAIFDASYIKLREANISYNIPKSFLNKFKVQRATLSLVGRNLALLYANVPHIDPETALNSSDSGQGWEIYNVPSSRSVSLSLTVEF